MKELLEKIKFNDKGLIPAIIQDEKTKEVLTLCYMNQDALLKALEAGKVYVFRRSKGRRIQMQECQLCGISRTSRHQQ